MLTAMRDSAEHLSLTRLFGMLLEAVLGMLLSPCLNLQHKGGKRVCLIPCQHAILTSGKIIAFTFCYKLSDLKLKTLTASSKFKPIDLPASEFTSYIKEGISETNNQCRFQKACAIR